MPFPHDIFYLGIKALIRNPQGKILLLHDTPRNKIDGTTHTYWDLPGGRIDNNQEIEETLRRETAEETGIEDLKIGDMFVTVKCNFRIPSDDGPVGLILFVYHGSIDPNSEIKLSDEHQEYGWFNPKKAAELLSIKYPNELTDKIKNLN